jgi:UDP-N-acetylglucosamine 2-epimerase (non-hydrolysing)
MKKQKFVFVLGTRPEAIKLAPIISEFQKLPEKAEVRIIVTAQHRDILDQVMRFFSLEGDVDLNLMREGQSLFDITAGGLQKLDKVFDDYRPDVVIVQGDTTSAFVGALAGFYKKIKVAHVEAGLRSGNKLTPFPEEMNRSLIGRLSDYHFAPTEKAKQNLAEEGIVENVWVVGNPVIDALFLTLQTIKKNGEKRYAELLRTVDPSKRIILTTVHRRESFGASFENVCHALKELAMDFKDIEIVYPVHPNPNIREPAKRILSNIPGITLLDPLDYPYLIWLMSKSYMILTDSGGIQEEAPSLGKPVLVLRDVTERIEGIQAGTAKLVGTNIETIVAEAGKLLSVPHEYKTMAESRNPYGDGKTSQRIIDILLNS